MPELDDALVELSSWLTEKEIRHALEGNLCRCTGYINIVEAIRWAADKMRGRHVSQ